jgi:hypothetical protein
MPVAPYLKINSVWLPPPAKVNSLPIGVKFSTARWL